MDTVIHLVAMKCKFTLFYIHFLNACYRPYSEQHHDRYEIAAVRDSRLTVFSVGSAVKAV